MARFIVTFAFAATFLFCFTAAAHTKSAVPPGNEGEIFTGTPTSREYVTLLGKEYFFENTYQDNWFGAGNFCARLNMTLVMIETEEEEVAIVGHIRVNYGELVYWTAGNNLANTDVWVWEPTGQAITYFDWHKGEPNHMLGEHCIDLDWVNGYLAWNNENEGKPKNIICERN